ncbi:MAG TPA: DNA-directed RNA polymerase subunit D [Thermoplasmata archaeon]|nr:DNA-directed RNA polymerase subunit D [Thermoplasmata archaeon]
MDIEILSRTETSMKLLISGVKPPFVNTLRRILIAEVPKMAIDRVEFTMGSVRKGDQASDEKTYESKTPLFDEIIAHRLAMVPIPTDLDLFGFRDECTCGGEGCPNCEIMYSLWKVGPCTVYSGDLELAQADDRFAIKEKLIPIVNLNEKQGLVLYATAILGKGKDHAKWQAANAVGYRYYPEFGLDTKTCTLCGECARACPRELIEVDKKMARFVDGYEQHCNLCNACVDACEPGALVLAPDETRFIFQFETDGALTASRVLLEAMKIGVSKFEDFRTSLGELGK